MPPNPESPGQFAQRPIPVLSSTPLHVRGLCHGHWQWFQFVTTGQRSVTTFARQTPLPPDTVVRTVRRATTVSETQAVVVQFDSMWIETQNRYATSDVIIVNGMGALNAMPSQWDVPATFNPTQAAAAAVPGTVLYRPGVDSLTLTLGFNTTLGDQGCASLVHPLVMVGVRCSWGSMLGFGCPFDIAATRVPRQVSDGDVITAPIEPDAMHYFAIYVGSFDVLSLSLRRLERFSKYVDALTGQARDHVDHGLLGSLIISRNTCPTAVNVFRPPPPPPVGKGAGAAAVSVQPDVRVVPIVNSTEFANASLFCTEAPQAGRYALAVHAATLQSPVGMQYIGAGCTNGYVGPDYQPLYTSMRAGTTPPTCNPNRANNEMKPNRPFYELTVRHQPFADGSRLIASDNVWLHRMTSFIRCATSRLPTARWPTARCALGVWAMASGADTRFKRPTRRLRMSSWACRKA